MKNLPKLSDMPPVPEGSEFELSKVDVIQTPHPYCIGSKHVAVASDHHGGILDEAAIEDAEKRGAVCDICREHSRRSHDPILPFREHQSLTTLYIAVDQHSDLNSIQGLHRYLFDNKAKFAELGIEGFAFPLKLSQKGNHATAEKTDPEVESKITTSDPQTDAC